MNWQNYYPYWENDNGNNSDGTPKNSWYRYIGSWPAGSYRLTASARGFPDQTNMRAYVQVNGYQEVASITYASNGNMGPLTVPFTLSQGVTDVYLRIVRTIGYTGNVGMYIDADLDTLITGFGYVNIDGTWRRSVGEWVNIDGAWRKVAAKWANIDGVWRKQI
ncbi:hypothetical protein [Cohnella nanjingensis]|uniref:Uncharacterized protein n=1 Tax=Cohnella nanjingensis TaxID=1387779 RepID=A0A7X0RQE9_9BACL|nr:hypothetical protein [Cohnella nanjingensis]MBB6670515.1 hypothetical protein [Cohnella nanjingensis]